jgi:hypothetical protein
MLGYSMTISDELDEAVNFEAFLVVLDSLLNVRAFFDDDDDDDDDALRGLGVCSMKSSSSSPSLSSLLGNTIVPSSDWSVSCLIFNDDEDDVAFFVIEAALRARFGSGSSGSVVMIDLELALRDGARRTVVVVVVVDDDEDKSSASVAMTVVAVRVMDEACRLRFLESLGGVSGSALSCSLASIAAHSASSRCSVLAREMVEVDFFFGAMQQCVGGVQQRTR